MPSAMVCNKWPYFAFSLLMHLYLVLQHNTDAKRVLGTLAISMRQVDKESGAESFDEPESQMTMIVCKSSDAAKKIVDKMPDPQK